MSEPWRIVEECAEYFILDAEDDSICFVGNKKHAELIVRAVNNFDSLRDALDTAYATIEALHGEAAWPDYQHSPEMKQINAAIRKATK